MAEAAGNRDRVNMRQLFPSYRLILIARFDRNPLTERLVTMLLESTIFSRLLRDNPDGFTAMSSDGAADTAYPVDMDMLADDIYVVALRGHELTIHLSEPDAMSTVRSWLILTANESKFFGGWANDGYLYLDRVEFVKGRSKAIALGRSRNQLAIYHPASGEDVKIN